MERKEWVVEIGAGIGTLTIPIAKRVGKVLAVELDSALTTILENILNRCQVYNVKIITRDFLNVELDQWGKRSKLKVVGNLPYQATSPILEKLVKDRSFITGCYLTVQFEVAERITAAPGCKEGSSLGIMIQSYGSCKLVKKIPSDAFYPPPAVDSALVGIEFFDTPRFSSHEDIYFRVVRSAFNLRRKTIKNALALSTSLNLTKYKIMRALNRAGIDPKRRGETLTISEFDRLANEIGKLLPSSD